jgi:hypothetical protein
LNYIPPRWLKYASLVNNLVPVRAERRLTLFLRGNIDECCTIYTSFKRTRY